MTSGNEPDDEDLTPEERRRRRERRRRGEDDDGPDAIDYAELIGDATDLPGFGRRGSGGGSGGSGGGSGDLPGGGSGGGHSSSGSSGGTSGRGPDGSPTGGGSGSSGSSGGCGGRGNSCDCDSPCDFTLVLRLSALLSLAAALLPGRAGRRPVLAAVRFYRRRLTRFTPACPSTPSCSAYAVLAVQDLGARRGLAAAARRIHDCGTPQR
jgi:hypothetical protein